MNTKEHKNSLQHIVNKITDRLAVCLCMNYAIVTKEQLNKIFKIVKDKNGTMSEPTQNMRHTTSLLESAQA